MLCDHVDDRVFLQEPSDLVQLRAACDLAVIPEPTLGIYFIRPVALRARAGYTIGASGDAVRRACADDLIVPTSRENGQAREIIYLLTAEGRRHCAINGHAPEATRPIAPRSCKLSKHDLEHRLVAAEACVRRGQACIDRQEQLIESRARGGLCTTRAQIIANTFGEIQSKLAKTLHIFPHRVFEDGR